MVSLVACWKKVCLPWDHQSTQFPRTTCVSGHHSNLLLMYLPSLLSLSPQVNHQPKCDGISKLKLNSEFGKNSSSWHSFDQQYALQLKMCSSGGYFPFIRGWQYPWFNYLRQMDIKIDVIDVRLGSKYTSE